MSELELQKEEADRIENAGKMAFNDDKFPYRMAKRKAYIAGATAEYLRHKEEVDKLKADVDYPIEIFHYINPALHLLHNGQPVLPNSKEHKLLQELWNKTD